MVDLAAGEPGELLAHLRAQNVLAAQIGPRRVRFVLHRDVGDDGVDRCLAAAAAFGRTSSPGFS